MARGLSHPEAMMVHACRRLRERCGIVLASEQYLRMVAAIREASPQPVAVTRDGMRFYLVRVAGVSAYALWKRGQIATFYPSLEWITDKGGKVLRQVSA